MKILISADMEGICGITHWDMVTPGHAEYLSRGRKLMTDDVNAAVAGSLAGGAQDMVVSDGHWDGRNILIEDLHPSAKLNTSSPAPFSMMEGIQHANRPDGVLLVGYHAMCGTGFANLDHTWSDSRIRSVFVNGDEIGEIAWNALVAGYFGVPVIGISGDQSACAEAKQLLGDNVQTAVIKHASSQFAAECLPLPLAREMIRRMSEAAVLRLQNGAAPKPFAISTPITLKIDFVHSRHADRASVMPGTTRLSGSAAGYTADDVLTAYRAFRAMASLARD